MAAAVREKVTSDQTQKPAMSGGGHDYKGFVAGVFSGIAKLSGKLLRLSLSIFPINLNLDIFAIGYTYMPYLIQLIHH